MKPVDGNDGASHAGKTLLVQRMLEEYGYPTSPSTT